MTDPETVTRVLERAVTLVDQGWCQHASALTVDGPDCSIAARDAIAWSVPGAIERAAYEEHAPNWDSMLAVLSEVLHCVTLILAEEETGPVALVAISDFDTRLARVIDWNDAPTRSRDEARAMLRAAAQRTARSSA